MTPQEAIETLRQMKKDCEVRAAKAYNGYIFEPNDWDQYHYKKFSEVSDALGVAIGALEKQIPKKPEMVLDRWKCSYNLFCPTCKSFLGVKGVHAIYIGEKPSHCTCGQKLNWKIGRYSEGRKDDTTNSD